jgi:hypothetical protein
MRIRCRSPLSSRQILAVVTISLVGVIALLDVAAAFALNGSVDVPFLLVLVVAVAVLVQLVGQPPKVDPSDVVTLVRLRLQAAALGRHTAVLTSSPGKEVLTR